MLIKIPSIFYSPLNLFDHCTPPPPCPIKTNVWKCLEFHIFLWKSVKAPGPGLYLTSIFCRGRGGDQGVGMKVSLHILNEEFLEKTRGSIYFKQRFLKGSNNFNSPFGLHLYAMQYANPCMVSISPLAEKEWIKFSEISCCKIDDFLLKVF